jgi:hypothetical protein
MRDSLEEDTYIVRIPFGITNKFERDSPEGGDADKFEHSIGRREYGVKFDI